MRIEAAIFFLAFTVLSSPLNNFLRFTILPIQIHFFVVAFIVAGGDVVHPVLMVEVPADGLLDTLLELQARLPAEFRLELAAVDGVAHVVAETVGDVGYQLLRLSLGLAQQTVDRLDDDLDEIDVLPLVESADVVGLGHLPLVEDEVDGAGVVLDEEPVAHVLTLAVDGEGFALTDVVDEEGYQFLRELVGTVVVGAVGDERRHAVGVVVGAHEVVARCLRCRIGGVGIVFGRLKEELRAVGHVILARGLCGERSGRALGMRQFERAVDLVGRYVVEEFTLIFLGKRLPVFLGRLEQGERAHDVGAGECEGILDRAVDVALGGEMDDAVDPILPDDAPHLVEVGDVGAHEGVVGLILHIPEVGEIAGVGQLVEVDDAVFGIFVDEEADHVGADEARAAGYQDVALHFLSIRRGNRNL